MKDLEHIRNLLRKSMPEIKKRYGVKSLYIFGSYSRNEQTKKSDIDILVEFEKDKKNFDNYMDLKFYLENLLNNKVDLILKEAVKPRLRKYIYKEAISV